MSRRRTFLAATLIALSYIVFLYFLIPPLARGVGHLLGISTRRSFGLTRLTFGLALCLLLIPLSLKYSISSYGRFLRESGLFFDRRTGAWLSAAIASTLLLSAAFETTPYSVCAQVIGYLGATPLAISSAIDAPLIEEFWLRGIVLGLLLRFERPWLAVLWSSVLFGLWHFPQGSYAVVSITIVSIFLFALPRLLSASIVPGALAHLFTNANVVMPTIWGYILVEVVTLGYFGVSRWKARSA